MLLDESTEVLTLVQNCLKTYKKGGFITGIF